MAVQDRPGVLQEAVAAEIAEQAREAIPASGFAVGAHLYERAAALTRGLAQRTRLLIAAAEAFVEAGDLDEAERVLGSVSPPASNGSGRTDVVRLRARIETLRGRLVTGAELLVAEAERIRSADPRTASDLLVEAALIQANRDSFDRTRSHDLVRRARDLAGDSSSAQLVVEALRVAHDDPDALSPDDLERLARQLPRSDSPEVYLEVVASLAVKGKFEDSLRVLNDVIDEARRSRARASIPNLLHGRANTLHRLGDWDSAARDYEEAIRLADELGQRYGVGATSAWLARLEAPRGREEACRSRLGRARHEFDRIGMLEKEAYGLASTERLLDFTLGEYERVLEQVIDSRHLRWAEEWIEAAILVGRRDDAETLLAAFEQRGRDDGHPVMQMRAARYRGLLAADADFERAFERTFELERLRPYAFERARNELCYGERLRRADERKRAREPLRSAHETFIRLGAPHWARRAGRELQATGARVRLSVPGAVDQLTAQELAVALAVAGGATNKEAAAQLFLSVKTIEFHLKNVYRKLEVRSRTELTRHLADH